MFAFNHQEEAVESTAREFLRRSAKRDWLVAVAVFCAIGLICGAESAAAPFSELVVFGDSLSDVGNVEQATGELSFLVPRTPGPYYYSGRFSNGPVFTELLASGLGLPPNVHSRSDGSNFAHGGALTSGTSFPNNIVVRDIDDQVSDFLAGPAADPNALFVVFAGSNDLVGGQTNVSVPVNRLATDIARLITDGARNFLVLNLPWLGYTPRYNESPTNSATFNTRSQQFNSSLNTMLDGLETGNPALDIFRFDVAALFNDAIANPEWFGLANVIDSAAPGLQPGDSSYNTSLIAPNANQYLFWDDLHPTAAVHAILAERLLMKFSMPGDFNCDDTVDAADYVVWRKKSGSVLTPPDLVLWRASYGEVSGADAATFAGFTVPESGSWQLFVTTMAFVYGFKWRFRLQ